MKALTLILYFFEVLAAVCAIGILITRNVFYGALLLLCCLLSIAAIYVLLYAEFVAVTQLLVYAGGIVVVIIFGVMLTAKIAGKSLVVEQGYTIGGTLIGIAFLVLLGYGFSKTTFTESAEQLSTHRHIEAIGVTLMRDFIFPFEVAGIFLLIVLIGAIVMASSVKSTKG